jgi:hypothetical protein
LLLLCGVGVGVVGVVWGGGGGEPHCCDTKFT